MSQAFAHQRVLILTGAGISAESGLKTFRDADGLWEGHRIEDVATPEAFARDPDLVYDFYNQRRRSLREVTPNAAHVAIAKFEHQHIASGGEFLLVTQNVDDLHGRAGSKRLLHMHGELIKARCLDRGEVLNWTDDLDQSSVHPRSKMPGRLRPHIVWFGEVPLHLDEIFDFARRAEVFIAIGTSGVVYPAAMLVNATPPHCRRILLNLAAAENATAFDEVMLGAATQLVPQLLGSSN
ncbi:MAG TPA: NAD-dependent deacylase [Pseudobdellovibrionaceae bacterium]|nr:NAD-dependent deacylase [Pseudobdellovibrionaceae bacterium]